MFWKFNLISTSHIETLLTKDDVTLRELMDEEDILQECKNQNKNLIDFLTRPDVMEEMLNLSLSEPEEDDEKLRYRYSNTACELLTSDVPHVNDALVGQDSCLLVKLYSFLETEGQLNPLLASFFSKIMGILITRKADCILEFLKLRPSFIELVFKNFGTSAIMDLLLRLVTCVEDEQLQLAVLSWLNSQEVVQRLIKLIDPAYDEDMHYNASEALKDMIRVSREKASQMQECKPDQCNQDPLLNTMESVEIVSSLLTMMFTGERTETVLVSGISVLLALLEVRRPGNADTGGGGEMAGMNVGVSGSTFYQAEMPAGMAGDPVMSHQCISADGEEERLNPGLANTLTALAPRIVDFHGLLLQPPLKKPMKTTIGELDPPLGNTRIHIARLITAIVATGNRAVCHELASQKTFKVLLDLFFFYSWNNFLHSQVEQSIGILLNWGYTRLPAECTPAPEALPSAVLSEAQSEVPPSEGACVAQVPDDISNSCVFVPTSLLSQLFTECDLLQRILDHFELTSEQSDSPSKKPISRKGYMGHLTRIANHIVQSSEKEQGMALKQLFKELPEDVQARWDTFVSTALVEINKRNEPFQIKSSHNAGGVSTEPDAPFHHDTALQQAFSDYQMQQMTSTFVDQFGFNDDEFSDQDDPLGNPLDRLLNANFTISVEENARNAEMFESACNERMQAFDDADSDDEIWDDNKELGHSTFTTSPPQKAATRSGFSAREIRKSIGVGIRKSSRTNSDSSSDSGGDVQKPTFSPVSESFPSAAASSSDNNLDTMEVDPSDTWTANFESMRSDCLPSAMDTTASPWDVPSVGIEDQSAMVVGDSSAMPTSEPAGWADFTGFGSAFESQGFSTEPVSSSSDLGAPLEMDVGDCFGQAPSLACPFSPPPISSLADSPKPDSTSSEVAQLMAEGGDASLSHRDRCDVMVDSLEGERFGGDGELRVDCSQGCVAPDSPSLDISPIPPPDVGGDSSELVNNYSFLTSSRIMRCPAGGSTDRTGSEQISGIDLSSSGAATAGVLVPESQPPSNSFSVGAGIGSCNIGSPRRPLSVQLVQENGLAGEPLVQPDLEKRDEARVKTVDSVDSSSPSLSPVDPGTPNGPA